MKKEINVYKGFRDFKYEVFYGVEMNNILELITDYDFKNTPKYKIEMFMSFIQIYIKEKNEAENRSIN